MSDFSISNPPTQIEINSDTVQQPGGYPVPASTRVAVDEKTITGDGSSLNPLRALGVGATVTVDGTTIGGTGLPGGALHVIPGGLDGDIESAVGSTMTGDGTTGSPLDVNPAAIAGQVPVSVDGVTITGDGTTGNPLVAVGGGSGADLPVFNIRDYGAVQGNPTLNRTALTNACAAAAAVGGIVFIPAGVWQLSRDGANAWAFKVLGSNYMIMGTRGASWLQLTAGQTEVPCPLLLLDDNVGITLNQIGVDGNWGDPITDIANASALAVLPTATINVVSTAGFPSSGYIYVVSSASGDSQMVQYNGITATSFQNCSGGTGYLQKGNKVSRVDGLNLATTVAIGSNGQALPHGTPVTINVASTTGWPTFGVFRLTNSAGATYPIEYTGITPTSFTGCTGYTSASGTMATGGAIHYNLPGINHQTQIDPKSHGIMLRGAQDCIIEQCQFRQVYGDMIWTGASNTDSAPTLGLRVLDVDGDIAARDGISFAQLCGGVFMSDTNFTNLFAQALDTEPVETWVRDIIIEGCYLGNWFNPGSTGRSGNAPVSFVGGKDTIQGPATNQRQVRMRDTFVEGSAIIHGAVDVKIDDCRFVSNWNGASYPLIYVSEYVESLVVSQTDFYDRTSALGGVPLSTIYITQGNSGNTSVGQPANVKLLHNNIEAKNGRSGININGQGGGTAILAAVVTAVPDFAGTATSIDASTTVAAGSNNQALPQATINVASTAGWPTHGSFRITTTTGTFVVEYTGIAGNSFTGCSGGSGTMHTNDPVAASILTDNTATWIDDEYVGYHAIINGVVGYIASNTATQLTMYNSLTDGTFRAVTGWGDPYNAVGTPPPAVGTYVITSPRGVVDVIGNTIDLSNDGNGQGATGIVCTTNRCNTRARIKGNIVKDANGTAIDVSGVDAARKYRLIEVGDNVAYDYQPTPTCTSTVSFLTMFYDNLILYNNLAGQGVPSDVVGLTTGVWLISAGKTPEWAGYGSPEGVITASPGSTYHRIDNGLQYTKQSGTGSAGWAPLSSSAGSTNPQWIDELGLVAGSYDPAIASSNLALVNGSVLLWKMRAYSSLITSIEFQVGTTITGGTHLYIGLYRSDGTQAADMATATVDAIGSFSVGGVKTVNFTNTVTVAPGDDIYVAMLVTGGPSQLPTIRANAAAPVNGNLSGAAGLRSMSFGSGLTAMPGSITLGSTSGGSQMGWVGLQ